MALVYQAELRPSKLELIEGWAPSQPWYQGETGVGLTSVASFRFDDPDGEVGVETLLVRAADGPIMQVPLTYRGAPLPGGEAWLIGTMEHSVLGSRWVYDGVGDPVYLQTAASAAAVGGSQAELLVETDGELVKHQPTAVVTGSGAGSGAVGLPAVDSIVVSYRGHLAEVHAHTLRLTLSRVPGAELLRGETAAGHTAEGTLTGTWVGQSEPQPLLFAAVR